MDFKYTYKYIIIFPIIICMTLMACLFQSLPFSASPYASKIICISVLILLVWFLLLILVYRNSATATTERSTVKIIYANGIIVFIIFLLAAFYTYTIWGSGYLSLSPIAAVNNGTAKLDTLFHCSIAESFKRSVKPSALVNDETLLRYHTFSHFLIHIVSEILSIPVYFVYNYLFPIIFLPIYTFSQLHAIYAFKKAFTEKNYLSIYDIIVVCFFNLGVAGRDFLDNFGIWKSSYIISESFLIGNTLVFLFYSIIIKVILQKKEHHCRYRILLATIPTMIFLVSWSKISVGCLFTLSIVYYFFRIKITKLKYWILSASYGLTFLVCLKLFNGGNGVPSDIKNGIQWFAFRDYCNGTAGLIGHYMMLSFIGIAFLICEIILKKYNYSDLKKGKTIWIEEILFISLFAFLPGMILNINGGSAGYFSYFAEIPALLLLCGNDYPDRLFQHKIIKNHFLSKLKSLIPVAACIWCTVLVYNNSETIIPKTEIMTENRSGFYDELMDFRKLAGNSPELYTFYLDQETLPTELFADSRSSIYVYPAITGIGVINASYVQDGLYYTFADQQVVSYGLKDVNNRKLSFDEALEKARKMGKEKIIHVTKEGYEIVECN